MDSSIKKIQAIYMHNKQMKSMHHNHNFLFVIFSNIAYGLSAFFELMPSPANIIQAGVLALVTSSIAFLSTKAWNIIFKTKEKDNEDK